MGDLGGEGGGGVVELLLGDAEGLGVVADDGCGGLLDALPELVEIAGGAGGGLAGGGVEPLVEELASEVEGLGVGGGGFLHALVKAVGHASLADELLAELLEVRGFGEGEVADGFLELLGEGGLGGLGLLGEGGGLLDEVGEALALLVEAAGECIGRGGGVGGGIVFRGEGARALLGGVALALCGGHVAAELVLFAGEVACLGAELAGGLVEFAGVLAAEILAKVLEFLLGAGAGGEGLGDVVLAGGIGGLLHAFACLVEALLGVGLGVAFLVFGALETLLELVGVGEVLALVFLEALEFAAEVFLFGVVAGLEGGLELLEASVHFLLALGEFLEAVEDLGLFAAFGVLGRLGLARGLVSILGLVEVELVDLLLVWGGLGGLGPGLGAVAGDLGLARGELEEELIGGLLGGEGVLQGGGVLAGLVEEVEGALHLGDGIVGEGGLAGVGLVFCECAGLVEGLGGGIADGLEVVLEGSGAGGHGLARGVGGGGIRERLGAGAGGLGVEVGDREDGGVEAGGSGLGCGAAALELPCGGDDLLLELDELGGGVA